METEFLLAVLGEAVKPAGAPAESQTRQHKFGDEVVAEAFGISWLPESLRVVPTWVDGSEGVAA